MASYHPVRITNINRFGIKCEQEGGMRRLYYHEITAAGEIWSRWLDKRRKARAKHQGKSTSGNVRTRVIPRSDYQEVWTSLSLRLSNGT